MKMVLLLDPIPDLQFELMVRLYYFCLLLLLLLLLLLYYILARSINTNLIIIHFTLLYFQVFPLSSHLNSIKSKLIEIR